MNFETFQQATPNRKKNNHFNKVNRLIGSINIYSSRAHLFLEPCIMLSPKTFF